MQTLVHEQIVSGSFAYLDSLPNIRSYPLNIGGKPTFSWPAMVPICFELTVLLGGHTTVLGLILLSRLYRPFRKVLHPDITNDKFCLWIPSDSENYSEEGLTQFMTQLGASEITLVNAEGQRSLNTTQETPSSSTLETMDSAKTPTLTESVEKQALTATETTNQ